MNTKEKLTEIIGNVVVNDKGNRIRDVFHPEFVWNIVENLTANGVIVLVCKIGDTVYQIDGVRVYDLEILDVTLRNNKPYYETESIDFDCDAIGKTVFLTREEAEAALKGKESNGRK